MNYTLAGLRQRVMIDKLDDEDFDPEIIDNFINDTQRDIFNQFELPFQEKIFSGVIPAGSTMFQLPADLAQVQSHSIAGVRNFMNNKARFRDFFYSYPDAVNEEPSQPSVWTQYAGNILLNAPTDKDYTLNTYYIRKPKVLDQDTSVPEIPEEFSELLILGALMRVHDRNEDSDLYDKVSAQYDRQLTLLAGRYGFRDSSGPIKMKNRQIG